MLDASSLVRSLTSSPCLAARRCAALVLAAVTLAPRAYALNQVHLRLADLEGEGWRAEQIELRVNLAASPITAHLTLKQAQLSGVAEPLRDVVIDCPDLKLLDEQFACAKARVAGKFPYLGAQQLDTAASYARSNGAITMSIKNLKLAMGRAAVGANLRDDRWKITANLQQLDLAALLKLAQQVMPTLGKDISAAGQLNARIDAQGRGALPEGLKWQAQARALTLGNTSGTIATDKLALASSGQAQYTQTRWQFDAQLEANAGQAYGEPIFVDVSQHPFTAHAKGVYTMNTSLQLDELAVQQQGIVNATARGAINFQAQTAVPEVQVSIARLQFPGTFDTYIQPFLINTGFKNLKTTGSVQGAIAIKNTWPTRIDLTLDNLSSDDGNRSLVFNQVNGELHWRDDVSNDSGSADTAAPMSRLSWQSGILLGIELGPTDLPLELWGTNVRIAEPTRIPIFNGALAVDAFRVRKAGTPQMAFMLDANIEPINVAQLCRAFGWPEFGGELAGRVTKLRLQQDTLTLGATLNAKVFAGDVAISNMRLEGALSQWPRFNADIKLDNLDLEQVTQAFSFGRITGRLSGEVDGLSLFNWQPVAMDARLFTPANDRSKHRISQRAVQNIGSIGGSGGGVSAALQSGFLRFFKDFNYDKLGISCRLENDVCVMNGVAPADNGGYYLVKGRGLPRIDVIGNSTRVDWPRLVAQLKAATEAGAPVVR